MYGFDLVTWPGFLTICGDIGTYTFCRTTDMFEFFEGGGGRVNLGYWAEKLKGGNTWHEPTVYNHERFAEEVRQWVDETCENGDVDRVSLTAAVNERLLHDDDGWNHDERLAIESAMSFEFNGLRIHEPYEWSLREYDGGFVTCCHAIVFGISAYRAATSKQPEEGGEFIACIQHRDGRANREFGSTVTEAIGAVVRHVAGIYGLRKLPTRQQIEAFAAQLEHQEGSKSA